METIKIIDYKKVANKYKQAILEKEKIQKQINKICNKLLSSKFDEEVIESTIIELQGEEFKQYVAERLNESNDSFVSEDGDVEKWVGKVNKSKVEEYTTQVEEYLENLKSP